MAASPNEVGRIHIRVVPNLKGFREKVEAEAKKAAKSASGNTISFKSKVENARGEAKRAASEASGHTVNFNSKIDKKKLKQEAGIAAIAASGQNIKFGIDIDRRGLKGLIRSIQTGFNSVDVMNKTDVIGKVQRQIATLYRGLERVRRSSVSMILTVMKGFNGFGRPLKYAYAAVQKLGRGMAGLWDRSELRGLYRQDLVDFFEHLGGKARSAFNGIKSSANSALGSVQGQLRKVGESDAWLKMSRNAEKAARHIRNINVRPVFPTKGRMSDAQIRLMQMRLDLDTSGAERQLKDFSRSQTARINVETKGVEQATSKLIQLKRTVDRTTTAKNLIGNDLGLAAAYGAFKGWNKVQRVLRFVGKWAAIAGLAIAALAPPLTALGGAVGMAALGAVGGIAAGLAVIANAGLSALFIGMAARSEEVKSAWAATRKSMAQTFDSNNTATQTALLELAPKVATAFERMGPSIGRVSEGVADLLGKFGRTLPTLADSLGIAMEQMFEAGRPGMEKLISKLPSIVAGLGNMFEVIGESEAIQRIWNGFIDWLPQGLVKIGRGFDNAAVGAGKLFDWFKSPGLEEFRTGFSKLGENFKNVDWSKAIEGVENMLNSMGKIAGDTDVQGLVDGLGTITTAISKLLDTFNELGLAGTIGVSVLSGILAGIAKELAASAISFGAKKLMEKLFGSAVDIAGEALDVGTDVAGGLLGGLLSGLTEGIAGGIGRSIGDAFIGLFTGKDKHKVDIEIGKVTWPDDGEGPEGSYRITKFLNPIGPGFEPKGGYRITKFLWPLETTELSGMFRITGMIWPGDTEEFSGKFEITEILWPDDGENLKGKFEVTGIIWPGGVQTLTGTLTITSVVLPEGLTEFGETLTALVTPLTQLNFQLHMMNTTLILLAASMALLPSSVTLFTTALLLMGTALLTAGSFLTTLHSSLVNLYNTLASLIPSGVISFVTALSQIPAAIAGLIGSLLSTGGGFSFFDGGIVGNIGSIMNFIGANGGIIGALRNLVSNFMGTGSGFSFFDGGLMGNIGSIEGFNGALGTVAGAISGMVSAVINGVSQVISTIASLPGQAVSALGNVGGLLVGAGQSLVQGFVNGIRNMIGAVRAAASEVAAAARAFFPFSPAKEGPFSGKGYTTHSGRALVKDFAGGMLDSRQSVKDAADSVMSGLAEGMEKHQKNLQKHHEVKLTEPILKANARKIAEWKKREAEALKNAGKDAEKNAQKAAERRQKLLESLEAPDFREINTSIRSFYIDGTKEMMQAGLLKQAQDTGFVNQLRQSAMSAIGAVRDEIGDHPLLAGVEANVNADHFEWAIQKAIEDSGIAYIPIELGIANLEQFKSDLGFGDGVISRGIAAALDFNPNESDAYQHSKLAKEEVHYHVSDMEEAIRLENERRSRQSLRFY